MNQTVAIDIDASTEHGSGLLLRSALALSVLTGKAVRLAGIRARRPIPGLKLQHIRLVEVMAGLCRAAVDGARLGSQHLHFQPDGELAPDSIIHIETPGSLTLLLQTVFLPLSFSSRPVSLRLTGVTHAARSPAFENIDWQWLPLLRRAGYRADIVLEKAGFAPKGGGVMRVDIQPVADVEPLQLQARGALLRIAGHAQVACLDHAVADRLRRQLMARLAPLGVPLNIVAGSLPAPRPGMFIVLLAEFEHSQQAFFTMGELGNPPETLANQAAQALISHLQHVAGALDPHLVDQLMLPLSFSNGNSTLSTSSISPQTRQAADLINAFLPGAVSIDAAVGQPGRILVKGHGAPRAPVLPCQRISAVGGFKSGFLPARGASG
ncbi:RNA 3'-terminal phosphate cyclase [Dechloromonas agitata]|uniref:RNA 3'-terminal phosphate cyclase n=1 Tax=Dechloromonas agitata TaxID=73030 RepID=UPI00237E2A83|nr:RNA 3'-terminal phosphate cyclase [Dechloromonas agitata]MDE1547350.1 RNA 3'-terminal phosphate cyclase [Dechloromonas agitata]